MISGHLQDGWGSDNKAKVNGEGEVSVVVHPHPPLDEDQTALPFRQYFTDTGDSSGSNDMTVNGSSTSQGFYICAQEEKDLYIKSVSIVIADAGATLNEFGNLSELTNGCTFDWTSQAEGNIVIADELKTNWNFVRLAGGNPSFGDGSAAFRANNVSGASEAYTPFLDFYNIFGLQYGIRLRKGTTDCLRFLINDNVSGLDEFTAIGYGIKF